VIAAVHQSVDDSPRHAERAAPLDPSQPPPKDAGEPWGRYQLLELVGSGNFGSVYRAWDPELEFEIAIKILHRHVADDRLSARLLSEGRALAKVRHANVVRVHGVQFHEGRVGLCMEYVRGETLETIMSRGRLSPREAVHVGQEICRALAAVHQAGFVHRDVTVRNVMRDLSGGIMLMDFGTGLRTSTNSAMNLAGTPMYMAPEVLAEEPASPRSDVYSIGVLLYHLVTGKFPVEGRTMNDLKAAHMLGRRTPLVERAPDLPIPFIEVVEHALAANPQQRCASAGLLLQELAAAAMERRTRTRSEYIVWSATALAGTALGLTSLGAVNSRYFNAALGRSNFANESVFDWFYWGVTAMVAPAVISIFVVVALGILTVGGRLLLNGSSMARLWRMTLVNAARRWRMDDVSILSSCALLLSVSALVAAWRYFLPFLDSLAVVSYPGISTTLPQYLSFLSPQLHPYHVLYRKVFIGVTIFCIAIWYPVILLALRKGEAVNRSIVAGGAAVLILSMLFLDFPYRLLTGDKRNFEAVIWRGESCFILGERQSELLMFCPQGERPRNRIVDKNAPGLERLHVISDIFGTVGELK
jgi:serine/threonine-protein kinase